MQKSGIFQIELKSKYREAPNYLISPDKEAFVPSEDGDLPVAQQGFPRPYALSALARGRPPYSTDVQQVTAPKDYSAKAVHFCSFNSQTGQQNCPLNHWLN